MGGGFEGAEGGITGGELHGGATTSLQLTGHEAISRLICATVSTPVAPCLHGKLSQSLHVHPPSMYVLESSQPIGGASGDGDSGGGGTGNGDSGGGVEGGGNVGGNGEC